MRVELAAQLKSVFENTEVEAVVLNGAGRAFCPGVDLSEYNGPLGKPWVSELCTLIEQAPKPVVASLHGMAMGAGLELALAAHARVAHGQTRLAMPDVKLGLIPGAGATQRLPRVLGAQKALEILLSGDAVLASDPRLNRLITRLTTSHPLEAAIETAKSLAAQGRWGRLRDEDIGFSDPLGYQTAVQAITSQLPKGAEAAHDIALAVESAQLLPFDQGMAYEKALFEDRLRSPEARAARHFLMAEKFAAVVPGATAAGAPAIRQIALLGTRDELGELAILFLNHGFGVSLATSNRDEAEAFDAWLAMVMQSAVRKGQITEEQSKTRMSLFDGRSGTAAVARADLIIEGQSAAEKNLPDAPGHAVWCRLAPTGRSDALHLHFYAPVLSRGIVEVATMNASETSGLPAFMSALARCGKSGILVPDTPGQMEEWLSAAFYGSALMLLSLGGAPADVDNAAKVVGFAEGPFEMMDRIGLAQVRAMVARMDAEDNWPEEPEHCLERLIREGRMGRIAGKGFYRYDQAGAHADEALERLLPPERPDLAELSKTAQKAAVLGGIVNMAANLLEQKRVRRASDIDLIMVKGFGFDRKKGGPLLQADLGGLFYLYKEMRGLAELSALWKPHQRIENMVKQGEGFFGRSVG